MSLSRITLALTFLLSTALPFDLRAQCSGCIYCDNGECSEVESIYQGDCQGVMVTCTKDVTECYCDCGNILSESEIVCIGLDPVTLRYVSCTYVTAHCNGKTSD
jgi:hypothetical protein